MQKWLTKLREMCDAKFPSLQHLVEEFPMLAALDLTDLELPGQFQQLDFSPDETVFVERIGSHVRLLRRHGVTLRRLELICSDGVSRFFSINSAQGVNSSDSRVMSVYRCVWAAVGSGGREDAVGYCWWWMKVQLVATWIAVQVSKLAPEEEPGGAAAESAAVRAHHRVCVATSAHGPRGAELHDACGGL